MKDDWKQVFASEQSPVTAIDVLLEPDATMLAHAEANNARLIAVYPKGFALDATHRPHITMIQRFVRTADHRCRRRRLTDGSPWSTQRFRKVTPALAIAYEP
jgi:hypothetical protein